MNTTQLKYALEIEKTGSITAAAQNLFLSQPNLSKAMKELESEVNIQIFRRMPKGMVPTREGKEFLAQAKVIYEQISNFDAKYTSKRINGITMTMCIPRATYLSLAITDFLNTVVDEDKISISIRECSPLTTIKAVTSGEAHIGVVRYFTKHEEYLFEVLEKRGIAKEHLLEFEPKIVMSQNHPLAEKEDISLAELEKYIELIQGDNEEMRRENGVSDVSALKGIQEKKIYLYGRGSQGDILTNVRGTYMWVSNMPEQVLHAGNLTLKKCSDQNRIARDILVYRQGHIFSEYEKNLCRCMKEKIKELYG